MKYSKRLSLITLACISSIGFTACASPNSGMEVDSIRETYAQEETVEPGDTHDNNVPDDAAIDSLIRTYYTNRNDYTSITEEDADTFEDVYFYKSEDQEQMKKLYDLAYRTHMFDGFDEKNLSEKERKDIIGDMMLNRSMILGGGMINYTVIVDKEQISIDGDKATIPFEAITPVEKGTENPFGLTLGTEGVSIEMKKKDNVWYLEPSPLVDNSKMLIGTIRANAGDKKDREGNSNESES